MYRLTKRVGYFLEKCVLLVPLTSSTGAGDTTVSNRAMQPPTGKQIDLGIARRFDDIIKVSPRCRWKESRGRDVHERCRRHHRIWSADRSEDHDRASRSERAGAGG